MRRFDHHRASTPDIEERAQSRSNMGDTMGEFRIKVKKTGTTQDAQAFNQTSMTDRINKDGMISASPSPEKMRLIVLLWTG